MANANGYMELKARLSGKGPLLMHNERLANPLDPIAREMKKISSNRKKTDENYEELARLEFMGGLYIDKSGPYIPTWNVQKCLVVAARKRKLGKIVEQSLAVDSETGDDRLPLVYKGPRDAVELWNEKGKDGTRVFADMRCVGVNNSRIVRTRPRFPVWSVVIIISYDSSDLNREEVEQILMLAGGKIGLCDHRPRFGRFNVEILR